MELALFGILIGSFTLALSGALMPGPLLTMTIVESVKRGFIAGPLIVLGHGVLEFALIIAIVKGGVFYLKQALVTNTISIIGGGVLLWMGLGMIIQSGKISFPKNSSYKEKTGAKYSFHPVVGGILVSLSNPYWLIWWLTIGLGYMLMAMKHGMMGILSFFIGHIIADLIWYGLVSYGLSRGKRFITDRLYRGIIKSCGFFLILFGFWFLYLGIQYFLIS